MVTLVLKMQGNPTFENWKNSIKILKHRARIVNVGTVKLETILFWSFQKTNVNCSQLEKQNAMGL